jgi:hypothetical protein
MPPRATAAANTRSPRRTRAAASPRHTRTAKPPRSIAFRASIESSGPTGQWPHLFLPPEASAFLGKRGAVRVIVRVGSMSFRRAAKPDGDGGHFILFNADMRERTGKEAGDRVMVGLELDRTPQELEVPREFAQLMHADGEAEAAFKIMPPSHRRGYLEFIEDAKRPEARARRMEQALRMMRQWAIEKRAKGHTKTRATKARTR